MVKTGQKDFCNDKSSLLHASAEKRRHVTESVPYSYYYCSFPDEIRQVPPHWHNEWEINYIRKGSGIFVVNGKEIPVSSRDIICISPGMVHSITVDSMDYFQYDTLVFSLDLLGKPSEHRDYLECIAPLNNHSARPPVSLCACRDPESAGLIQKCMECARMNQARKDLELRAFLQLFFLRLWNEGLMEPAGERVKDPSDEIKRVLTYLETHYSEDLQISDLAGICALSPSRFMKRFVDETGQTALNVLMQIRIRAACELLKNTEWNISQIALEVGYSSLANFNRRFLQIAGLTPSAFRKKLKSHPE